MPIPVRAVVAIVAVASLIIGVWMGLSRIGWTLGTPPAASTHGVIIVLGFLGTVIGMERAVAMDKQWGWITPTFSAAAALVLLFEGSFELAALLLLVGGLVLVGLFGAAYRIQPEAHIILMAVGAGSWVLAAASWMAGNSVPSLVPWLAAFLVLTIAGERLELARLIATTKRSKVELGGATVIVLVGSSLTWLYPDLGARLAGLGILLVAVWLIRYDIARRTVRLGGVTTYMASGLLVGYGWLLMSGVLWLASGLDPSSAAYDAALHTLFLGFVMSMIMAHAPVVIPALAGLPFPYTPALWIPLVALQVTVAMRVVGGLWGMWELRRWGAMLNAVTLALFLLMVIAGVTRGQIAQRRRPAT